MSRGEIEETIQKQLPKYYQSPDWFQQNAPKGEGGLEWDVTPDKTADYYSIDFDRQRLLSVAIIPALGLFAAVIVVVGGARWVIQGFKT